MRYIFILCLISSCAHHHSELPHHHHDTPASCYKLIDSIQEFDKTCPPTGSEGDQHIKENKDSYFKHGGYIYYFSTEKKQQYFIMKIEELKKSFSNKAGSADAR